MKAVGRLWKIQLPLMLAAGVAAGWLGFRFEKARLHRDVGPALPVLPASKRPPAKPPDEIARLNEIRSRSREGGLGPQDLAECWQAIRGFDVARIRACLDEPVTDDRSRRLSHHLTGMLFSRWAQIDPQAAAEETLKRSDTRQKVDGFEAVMATWIPRDPEAALKWAAQEWPDDDYNKSLKSFAWEMAGEFYVRDNSDTALSRAANHPEALASARKALALKGGGGSEEDRQRYFKLTLTAKEKPAKKPMDEDDPEDEPADAPKDEMVRLAKTWAQTDPGAALASTERYGMAGDRYREFRTGVIGEVARFDPIEALDWTRACLSLNPEQATGRVDENDRLDLTIMVVKKGAERLLIQQGDGSPTSTPSLAPAVATHFRTWQRRQPDEAALWLSQQPAGVREQITDLLSHATKH